MAVRGDAAGAVSTIATHRRIALLKVTLPRWMGWGDERITAPSPCLTTRTDGPCFMTGLAAPVIENAPHSSVCNPRRIPVGAATAG